MSVGLYVMTEKGAAVLQAALESGVEISHVTTAPAKGMNDASHVSIAAKAKQHGIPTFMRAHPPEFIGTENVAAGWRWMLDVPNLVVLHDSLLPRYRGFAPLITALVNGEPEIGVSAFLAADEPDTGPIISQRAIPVAYPARMRWVLDRLIPVYGGLAAELFATLAAGQPLRYTAQDHARATWSLWRDDDDYRIDWTADDRRICRLVDAASDPFPGAWTTVRGERVVVHGATPVADLRIEDRTPGKVLIADQHPVIVCGTGLIRAQIPGFDGSLRTRFV